LIESLIFTQFIIKSPLFILLLFGIAVAILNLLFHYSGSGMGRQERCLWVEVTNRGKKKRRTVLPAFF
jgi:hypothetical protein